MKDPGPQPKWLTLNQAAEMLGMKRSNLSRWLRGLTKAECVLTWRRRGPKTIEVLHADVAKRMEPCGGGA